METLTPASAPPPPLPRRSRAGLVTALALVVLCAGSVALALGIAHTHPSAAGNIGPYVLDQSDPANPHNRDAHWHAALGVWECGRWASDGSAPGAWLWPSATPEGSPAHADDPNRYAGMHSHDDGIIHMEPATAADAGIHATLGNYFASGGWEISATGLTFLGDTMHDGDRCEGAPGALAWWVNTHRRSGDPASYKLFNDDIVVIAFQPAGAAYPGEPPSARNLPDRVATVGARERCVKPSGPWPAGAPVVPVRVGPAPTRLVIEDLKTGSGAVVGAHATITANYVGVACSTGKVFDSSYAHGGPVTFPLDAVIRGWSKGIPGMRVGGRRLLAIPPAQAYGAAGVPPAIGPDETLWFVVEVTKSN